MGPGPESQPCFLDRGSLGLKSSTLTAPALDLLTRPRISPQILSER